MMSRVALLLVALGCADACGILGLRVPCEQDRNCPTGTCVDGVCTGGTRAEGEGEGAAGEGEGAAGEGEGTAGEGEGATGEGEGAAGEGEGEGTNPDCGVVVPAAVGVVDAIVATNTTVGGPCFTSLNAAFEASLPASPRIYIAPGTYDEPKQMVPQDGVHIFGDDATRGTDTIVRPNAALADFDVLLSVRGDFDIEGVQLGDGSAVTGRIVDLDVGGATPTIRIASSTLRGAERLIAAGPVGATFIVDDTTLVGPSGANISAVNVVFAGGSMSITNSTILDAAIFVQGSSTASPAAFSMSNVDDTIDVDSRVDVDFAPGAVHIDGSFFSNEVVTGGNCQGALVVHEGTVVVRGTEFRGFACNFINGGAIDVPALSGAQVAPSIDLGTSGDAGNNVFSENQLDIAVHYASTPANLTIDAFGDQWTGGANPCVDLSLEAETGHTVAVDNELQNCVVSP